MGGFTAQVQQPTNPTSSGGKGFSRPTNGPGLGPNPLADRSQGYNDPGQSYETMTPMGKGGNYQNSATSGQPRIGQPNQYPNTVGQWDNAQIQPVQQQGKGKGA